MFFTDPILKPWLNRFFKITEEKIALSQILVIITICIGLSIASARPNVKLYAVDISPAALLVQKNIAWQLEKRVALEGSLPKQYHQIVLDYQLNPPYIPTADITDKTEPEVRLRTKNSIGWWSRRVGYL